MVLERHDGWRDYKYPEVIFTNKETGEKVIGRSICADNKGKSKIGERVTLHYNKSKPTEVIIDSIENIWYVPINCGRWIFIVLFI